MTTLLLEPHYDDATLFAAYTILRERPMVVTVFGGETVQEGVSTAARERENRAAMNLLGVDDWSFFPISEKNPSLEEVCSRMAALERDVNPTAVWVPLWEKDGHEQHNAVADIAAAIFSGKRIYSYATYRRGEGRTQKKLENVPEPGWRACKFAAMACFHTQIELDVCRPWFSDWDREWIA